MTTYTKEQVEGALNRAADDVLDAIKAGDEGERDVANLVVNAGLHYLEHPQATLATAITAEYDDAAETVLGWCRS